MFAVVCAASKGIGRATAEALAKRGFALMMNSRDEELLLKTTEEIKKQYSVVVEAFAGDLRNQETCKNLILKANEKFGRIDALLTNAGGPKPGNFGDVNDKDWKDAFELTFLSVARLVREVLPIMRKQQYGRICAIQSTSVKHPIANLILSNAIRPSVVGLFKSLSVEEGKHGITFNVVGPGMTSTGRVEQLFNARSIETGKTIEELRKAYEEKIPLGRFASPSEVGEAAAFLLSEESSYITGQIILADGGIYPGVW